jgi:hypothetical protein
MLLPSAESTSRNCSCTICKLLFALSKRYAVVLKLQFLTQRRASQQPLSSREMVLVNITAMYNNAFTGETDPIYDRVSRVRDGNRKTLQLAFDGAVKHRPSTIPLVVHCTTICGHSGLIHVHIAAGGIRKPSTRLEWHTRCIVKKWSIIILELRLTDRPRPVKEHIQLAAR